ncbi:MAG: hypothetical protein ABFC57_09100 [Veillonellales bacterium]
MKIAEYWNKFTSRERRLMLVGVGAAVIVGIYGLWDSRVAVAPVPPMMPVRADGGAAVSQPAMPQGYSPPLQGNGELRDPFAIPPGYQDKEQSANTAALGGSAAKAENRFSGSSAAASRRTADSSTAKQQAALPVLTGVGGADSRRVALIQYGGRAQPYETGEMIGSSYQLLAVYDSSATLWGPNGKLVLTLGR